MDEKKKVIVLAVLGLVTLGVAVPQFMPKGEEPVPAVKKDTSEYLKANEEAKVAASLPLPNPLMAANLPAKDPFRVPSAMQDPSQQNPVKVNRIMEPPVRRSSGNFVRNVGSFGSLSGVTSGEVKVGPVTLEIEKPKDPEFAYTVGGVVVGARPAVVFKDAAGNQRLVMQGGDLDGDSSVKSVRMDHVVVVYKGKSLHLKVGGQTVAK